MTTLLTRSLLIGCLGFASLAVAQAQSVSVQADVVFASTASGKVDNALIKMRDTLAQKVKYNTLSIRKSETLTVSNRGATVTLPNGKVAELSLEGIKDGVATLRVKLPPTDATYSLAKEKSFYLQGGTHEGGELWLVLSQPK